MACFKEIAKIHAVVANGVQDIYMVYTLSRATPLWEVPPTPPWAGPPPPPPLRSATHPTPLRSATHFTPWGLPPRPLSSATPPTPPSSATYPTLSSATHPTPWAVPFTPPPTPTSDNSRQKSRKHWMLHEHRIWTHHQETCSAKQQISWTSHTCFLVTWTKNVNDTNGKWQLLQEKNYNSFPWKIKNCPHR